MYDIIEPIYGESKYVLYSSSGLYFLKDPAERNFKPGDIDLITNTREDVIKIYELLRDKAERGEIIINDLVLPNTFERRALPGVDIDPPWFSN